MGFRCGKSFLPDHNAKALLRSMRQEAEKMSPQTIAILLMYGLRYGPEAIKAVRSLFAAPQPEGPSEAQWQAVFATMQKPYESYIADAEAELGGLQPGPVPPNP